MDTNPTPFPAKRSQCVKSKYIKKINEPTSKANAKDPSTQRQKRAFGTARNPNIPTNPTTQKPVTKPSSGASQTQPKSTKSTQPSVDLAKTPVVIEPAKKSPEANRTKPKKKSVCFQENTEEIVVKDSSEPKSPLKSPFMAKPTRLSGPKTPLKSPFMAKPTRLSGPKTPLKSPFMAKPTRLSGPKTPLKSPCMAKPTRLSGTPYHTAQRCGNCSFDRLETSAYWLTQIKQAEALEKHFVSVAFFQLAFDSKAEPIRNLRVELKKYLARHELLSAETEWINVSRTYGLLKEDKTDGNEVDSGCGEGATSDPTRQIQDQAIKEEALVEEAEISALVEEAEISRIQSV